MEGKEWRQLVGELIFKRLERNLQLWLLLMIITLYFSLRV